MKRSFSTFVATVLALAGIIGMAKAQPGPLGEPPVSVNQKIGITTQDVAKSLRESSNDVEISHDKNTPIASATVKFTFENKQWQARMAVQLNADGIGMVSLVEKLDKVKQAQIAELMRLKLPQGQKFRQVGGWLVLESEIRRAPNQVSKAELVEQIELMLGTVAATHSVWGQSAQNPSAPAPMTNSTPVPEAPKAPAATPPGAPSIDVIKAIVEKACRDIAYTDTTTKLTFTYKSPIRFGAPYKRAFGTVGGGRVLLDMYPVTLEFQRTENWASGTVRTFEYKETFHFFLNNGKWDHYRVSQK